MVHLGFECCDIDQAVFFCQVEQGLTIVLVHVDDCTIAATSVKLIEEFKVGMKMHVEITDLGELHWLLGIEIKKNHKRHTIHLSQHSYINSILQRYHFNKLKPMETPMETHIHLLSS